MFSLDDEAVADSNDESSDEEDTEEVCTDCQTPGTLILCDCCPRAYHLHCAKPGLKKVAVFLTYTYMPII